MMRRRKYVPKVPQLDQAPGSEVAAPARPTLEEIKADIEQLKVHLETYGADSPALRFAVQRLTEATTGIRQHLQNLVIDAQMAARDAEKKARQG
jgi:ABC-type transporter Mla subunit MlaD